MKDIDRLIVEINCYLREQKLKELLEKMTPEERQEYREYVARIGKLFGKMKTDQEK